jgi:molybdenum cofactor biosynthesis protein B
MSSTAHRASAPAAVRLFVITVSDTRTEATDASGRAIVDLLTKAGHQVVGRQILKDDPADVAALVRHQAASGLVDVIITTGGTGITRRDSTFEALDALLDKRLPGFGELFRLLSFQDIGPAAMLSRACAGTCRGTVVVALPGSESAVRLALTRLLLPELGHLVAEIRR